MTKFFDDKTVNLINNSEQLSGKERVDLFYSLYTDYNLSIIPVRGGFPKDLSNKAEVRKYKGPILNDWPRFCFQRAQLKRHDLKVERAGICCGPASGIIVLDIDNVEVFKSWCINNQFKIDVFQTLVIKSGRHDGGFHVYLRYPQPPAGYIYRTRTYPNVFSIIGATLQVLCPGSLHPETRNAYKVVNNKELIDAPQWVLDESITSKDEKKTQSSEKSKTKQSIHTQKILDRMVVQSIYRIPDKVADILYAEYQLGERSEPFFSAVHKLLELKFSENDIYNIFSSTPLGEKAFEKNDPKGYIEYNISKAQEQRKEYSDMRKNLLLDGYDEEPKNYDKYKQVVWHCLDELHDESTDLEFLINDFWPKGDPLLLTGEGGAGKSLFALAMAFDLVAEGKTKFLDLFDIFGDNRVLFMQSENSKRAIIKRFRRITDANQVYKDNMSKIRFFGANNDIRISGDIVNNTELRKILIENIEDHQANVLVIDPLISFHSADENSNDQMRRVLDAIVAISDKHKLSTMIIHHEVKTSQRIHKAGGRGASAIGDWAAYSFNLFPPTGKSSNYILTPNKTRDFETPDQIHLDFDSNTGRFVPVTTQSSPSNISNLESIIFNIVKKNSTISFPDLAKHIAGHFKPSKPPVRKTINKSADNLVKSGKLLKTKISGKLTYTLPK